MLSVILNASGVSLSVATLLGVQSGRIRRTTGDALWMVANVLMGLSCILDNQPGWAALCAAVAAWCAYDWWHKGGGDGTRRRLKSWARRFQGVRRTAPQGA